MTFAEKKKLIKWLYGSNFDYNMIYNISLKVNGIPPIWINNIQQIASIYMYVKAKTVY